MRRAPLLPGLIFMIIVTQLPFVATLVISFARWNALAPANKGWAGFDNYRKVFTDSTLRSAVFFTIVLTVVVVLVSLVLGMLIALLLDRAFFGRGIVRTLMITPFLIVPVAAALVFKHGIYNPSYGLLNGTLTAIWNIFGGTAPQPDWLTDSPEDHGRGAVDLAVDAVHDADPAGRPAVARPGGRAGGRRWTARARGRSFRFITMPHLRKYLELGGLLGAIYIVQNFDSVFTITSGGLGTANLPYTIYQTFYSAHDYGLASAQGVVVVIGSLIIATFALRVVSSLFEEG